MHYDPRNEDNQQSTSLIQQCTGPRPFAWLSSADNKGNADLSVFKHWQWLAPESTMLTFSAAQSPDGERARTVLNAEENGWFVWNMASQDLEPAVLKSMYSPANGQDPFEHANVAKAPCISALCPRVMQSPAHLECRYISTQRLPGNNSGLFIDLVFAEVVRIHIKDEYFTSEQRGDLEIQALLQMLPDAATLGA